MKLPVRAAAARAARRVTLKGPAVPRHSSSCVRPTWTTIVCRCEKRSVLADTLALSLRELSR